MRPICPLLQVLASILSYSDSARDAVKCGVAARPLLGALRYCAIKVCLGTQVTPTPGSAQPVDYTKKALASVTKYMKGALPLARWWASPPAAPPLCALLNPPRPPAA